MAIMMLISIIIEAGIIHPHLQKKLNALNDSDMIRVIVHLKNQADLKELPPGTKKYEKIEILNKYAQKDQADLLNYIKSLPGQVYELQSFWIFNGLSLKTTKSNILTLAIREDIDYIIDDFTIALDNKITESKTIILRTPELNLRKIMADSCWDRGYDGADIIVGNMDTGVDVSHPAFGDRWIPGGWYDAVNGQPNPYDDNGHGTHVMGVICGGDGNGPFIDDIGVAPGARFICAKALNSGGSASVTWIHECFQWFATREAKVVNNSWSQGAITSLEFWNDCMNLRNLGIFPVFSIGGGGPGSGTAKPPGNFPITTGVGAVDLNDDLFPGSARGPAPNQPPWNDTTYWARPDWDLIKPDIVAPGINIRSSIPGGGYALMSGTSMSAPHVSGAFAILLQEDSTASYEILYQTLLNYADHPPQGEPYPNNDYGWGRLNIWWALQEIIGIAEQRVMRIKSNYFSSTIFSGPLLLPEGKNYKIFDITGRVVMHDKMKPGIYFIEVEGVITQKVVKIR